jgi:hypothetical protein
MPKKPLKIEETESRDRASHEDEAENRFSQDHDDQAGRLWHGLTSEIEPIEVDRFEEDVDEIEPSPPPGRSDRV